MFQEPDSASLESEVEQLREQLKNERAQFERERQALQQELSERTAALKNANQLFQLVLDTIPARVFWKDVQSVYLGCNNLFASDAGLDHPSEIVGRSDWELPWAMDNAQKYRGDDKTVMESGKARLNYEEPQTRAAGPGIWVRTSKIPLRDKHSQIMGVLGTYEDITIWKRTQEQLEISLREKEILLKELYHRTKNNLQVVQAMLTLKSFDNPEAAHDFEDISHRLYAMGLVHEKLYESQNLNSLDLAAYLGELVEYFISGMQDPQRNIRVEYSLPPVQSSIDIAVPLGLVLCELMSNANKHAFCKCQDGLISITLGVDDSDLLTLEFKDDGSGFPPDFDWRREARMGLETIIGLVEEQLSGTLKATSASSGICWDIRVRNRRASGEISQESHAESPHG